MKLRNWLHLLVGILFSAATLHAQNDSLLCTFFRLDNGEVWVGKELSRTDGQVIIQENLLGQIGIAAERIKEETNLFVGTEVKITTTDRGHYDGKIVAIDQDFYIMAIGDKEDVAVPKAFVVSFEIIPASGLEVHNPNSTRYLFAPSAIPLKKGTGYYQNAYILLNSANYGLTDHISIGGGVGIPIFFFVNPKVGTKVAKNLYVAGGAIAATTFIGDNITLAIPFGAVTYGNEENNATLAAGYGLFWFDGDFEHSKYPIGTLNGMMRISNRLHLITENWGIPVTETRTLYDPFGYPYDTRTTTELYAAIAAGLRIKVGQVGSLDVAPVFLYLGGEPVVVPYIDFVYKF